MQPASPEIRRTGRLRVLLAPALLAHVLAYPLALASALAAIPPALILRNGHCCKQATKAHSNAFVRDIARGLSLSRVEAAQLQVVLEASLLVSAIVFALAHVAPGAGSGTLQLRDGVGLACAE